MSSRGGTWETPRLGDLITVHHGYAFPGEGITDEPSRDVLVTPGNFRVGGGFKSDKLKYFAGETPPDFVLAPGALIVTMTDLSKGGDTLGYPAWVPPSSRSRYLHNQRIGLVEILRSDILDLSYLYYGLCTPAYRHEVLAGATGSTVRHTSPSRIVAYHLPCPPLAEQRAIASTLAAVDNKIELNRQMNETLEAMARALFKSWFVDFDPVRAKMAGRAPFGMDAATAALFPARLRDTPLSPLPSDWDVTTLGDICAKPQYGLTASAHWGAHGPRFLRITDINKDAWIHWAEVPRCAVDPEVAARYALRRGDILIARMADPGHVAVVDDLEEPAVFASYLIRFRPRDEATGKYIQYVGRSTSYWDYLAGIASGSAQQNVNAPALAAFRLALPPAPVLDAFSNQVSRLRGCGHAALRESRTLAELRDLLLPKLLSGELRIRDAEKAVEAVI